MYFSTAVALAALPFLVEAVPAQNSLRDFISIPLSKRSTFKNADRVVNTASLEANIHQTVAKIQRGFKTFQINTGQAHPLAPKQGKGHKRRFDFVPLTDDNYNLGAIMMWTGKIKVGTPSKEFTVQFDTGSADLVLPGNSCSNCGGRNIYNHSRSSTSKHLGKFKTVFFGDGDMAGDLFTDNVQVGGYKATHQTLGAVSQLSPRDSASTFNADGVLGWGFKGLSEFNTDPFFMTLVHEGRIKEPVFGVVLAENDSELILGGTDTSRFRSRELTYLPIEHPAAFWQIKFDSIIIDGNRTHAVNKSAVIDSGIDLILGDLEDITKIYDNILGSARLANSTLWTIPCNATADIIIDFGDARFSISPNTYVGQPAANNSNETCFGGFAVAPLGFWVFGEVFLQNVYTEFDFGKRRVGFGALDS